MGGNVRSLVLAIMLAAAAGAATAQIRSVVPWPQVVLLEGAREPRFVLYSDRNVIFRATGNAKSASGYLTTRILEPRHQALMSAIVPEALLSLADSYLAGGANAPATVLHLWLDTREGGRRKTVSVFGRLDDPAVRAKVPGEFLRAYDTLVGFSAPGGHWVPANFDVVLQPMAQSRGEPVPWPKGVPPDGYHHKLDAGTNRLIVWGSKFGEIQRLVANLKPGQAVRLQERNWSIAYRLPFPYEEEWEESARVAAARPPAASAQGAEPRVVLLIGGGRAGKADSPSFALYADRMVIFAARERSGSSPFLSTRLNEARHEALVSGIAPEALLKLREHYDAIRGTDPLYYEIHVWVDGRRKTVSVSGHLERYSGRPPLEDRAGVPPEFLRAYDTMVNFSPPAKPWLPPSVEVFLHLHNELRGELQPWPQGWPWPRVYKGNLHRAMLPASEFGRVQQLSERIAMKGGGVLVAGRSYAMGYRLPFPRENTWVR